MSRFLYLLLFLLPAISFATPAEILIIRHGEKPKTGNDLSDRGYQRANALVHFFETNPNMLSFGTPVAIYAASPNDDVLAGATSLRSIETVTPTAQALGLEINETFSKGEAAAAIEQVMNDPAYDGKTVLFCWEHDWIPALAQDLGYPDAPKSWDDDTFDRVWLFDFQGGKISFQNLPQRLLPGDSKN